jgi:hypothetical protein
MKNENERIKAGKILRAIDLNGINFPSGFRKVRSEIYYGDRFLKGEQKSLFIAKYRNKDSIELHFFEGFYPKTRSERSAFFTWYFEKASLAGNTGARFKRWRNINKKK